VVLVHRLREVAAQVGFTRFEAAVADIHGDIPNDLDLQVRRAPLSLDVSWLPAIENLGEGIFVQFKAQAVNSWVKRYEVVRRGELLVDGFDGWKTDHKNSSREFPGLPYYLLHSMFHLLMTAISWPVSAQNDSRTRPNRKSQYRHQRDENSQSAATLRSGQWDAALAQLHEWDPAWADSCVNQSFRPWPRKRLPGWFSFPRL
jgi:hypothetical protein